MSPVTPGASTTTSPTRPRDVAPDPHAVHARAPEAVPAHPGQDDDGPVDGRSTRWADHREARRAELVRIARRTVHHRGPDVSMEEIAAAAGTSKSIVYRYFTDKTGLQIAVAEAVVLQIRGALEGVLRISPTPREGLRAMVAVYLEMIESSPHVYAFVTRDGSVESGGPLGHFLDSVTALVAAPFVRGLTEEGRGVPRAMAESWAAGAVGFVRGAGEWWLAHRDVPDAPDRETLTGQVAAWLWAGPVGMLARTRPAASADPAVPGLAVPDLAVPDPAVPDPAVPDPAVPDPAGTDHTPHPAHPAARPTAGDDAAHTPREQR